MDLGVGDRVEIKTRKKMVEPRTAAQKAYVKSLFKNELAFGIGPPKQPPTPRSRLSAGMDKISLSRPCFQAHVTSIHLPPPLMLPPMGWFSR
jgi:phosphate starvation-inducible PhoH-like protein